MAKDPSASQQTGSLRQFASLRSICRPADVGLCAQDDGTRRKNGKAKASRSQGRKAATARSFAGTWPEDVRLWAQDDAVKRNRKGDGRTCVIVGEKVRG